MVWDDLKTNNDTLTAEEWNNHVTDQKSRAKVEYGSGEPTSTPNMVGSIYVDTTNNRYYVATGTTSSNDWQEISSKEYVDIAVSSLGVNYYLTDIDSGIEDYKETSLTDPDGSEASITKSGLSDGDYVMGFISPLNNTPEKLLYGIYSLHIEAEKTAGTQDVQLYWELVERKSDNSETVIATSSSSAAISARTGLIISLFLPEDYDISAGSRIVGKLRANVFGSGNAPTIVVYYKGTTGTKWALPANTEVLMGTYVPYEGATKDLDLGSNNLTANSIVSNTTITYDSEYSTTSTIDWNNGNKQSITLTTDTTLTFTNPSGPCNLILKVIQDSTGGWDLTFPAEVKWEGGTAPDLTGDAGNVVRIVSLYFDGTNYYAQISDAY